VRNRRAPLTPSHDLLRKKPSEVLNQAQVLADSLSCSARRPAPGPYRWRAPMVPERLCRTLYAQKGSIFITLGRQLAATGADLALAMRPLWPTADCEAWQAAC
jgi:hypothetical protein